MSEEEMLVALFSDAPEGTFYSLREERPNEGELAKWNADIGALPHPVIESWCEATRRAAGKAPTTETVLRRLRRLMSEAAQVEETAWPTAPAPRAVEFSSVDVLPANVRASLESAGGSVVLDRQTGAIVIALNGLSVVRIFKGSPFRVEWTDTKLGGFLRAVMEYERNARDLQANRGLDTFGLRGLLREQLRIAPLLAAARDARCVVEQRGGLRAREYFISHLAFGEIVRLTVFRGTSHVVDVAFSSPRVSVPIGFLVNLASTGEQ